MKMIGCFWGETCRWQLFKTATQNDKKTSFEQPYAGHEDLNAVSTRLNGTLFHQKQGRQPLS